jgi:hypothetical protein
MQSSANSAIALEKRQTLDDSRVRNPLSAAKVQDEV